MAGLWSQVWPNLLASLLWAVPGFTVHHLLLVRHITRRTARPRPPRPPR